MCTQGEAESPFHSLGNVGNSLSANLLRDSEYQLVPLPAWKRVLDIVFASGMLFAVSPIMVLSAIYIKTVSTGPVFFRQERIGQGGAAFTCLKFRSMFDGSNSKLHEEHVAKLVHDGGNMLKLHADPRILPGGRIMRLLCIDELPQLINVLRGEMSLVGPRPCLPYEAEYYLPWHRERFAQVPGITGLWQVSGKNALSFDEMVQLDIAYGQKLSLALDLWILLKTPFALLQQACAMGKRS